MKPAPILTDERLTEMLHASRRLVDAPEAVIQKSLQLLAPVQRAASVEHTDPVVKGLRKLVATLGFDTASLSGVAAGLRSEQRPVRQLLYFSDGRDVDIHLTPVAVSASSPGHHWRVSGQILGPDTRGEAVLNSGGKEHVVLWTDMAEFVFPDVAAGPCHLLLRTPQWELHLPPIDLPA